MDTGGNMNLVPLNTTAVTPTTPGSDFGTMLMVLQILFRTKKFDQQPEQNLEMIPNITWSQSNFTIHGQPNPKESKTTHEEHNNVTKIIKKRETRASLTADENFLLKRQAGKDETQEIDREFTKTAPKIRDHSQDTPRLEETTGENQMQNFYLHLQNVQDNVGNVLMTIPSGLASKDEDCCNSVNDLQPLPVPPPVGEWQRVMLVGFGPGSKIVIRGRSKLNAPRLTFDLQYSNTVALHIDNRWFAPTKNELRLNTYDNGWGPGVVYKPAQIHPGANFVVTIECLQHAFQICINDAFYTTYTHTVLPGMTNQLSIRNAADISSIYYRESK